jgi:hypothetical protein
MRKCTMPHSVRDLWSGILTVLKQVQARKFRLENKSRAFYPSTLSWCASVMHAPLETIAVLTRAQAQDPFPYKEKSQEPLEAYSARGTVFLSKEFSFVNIQ